jgi:hypothetical protein
MNAKLPEELEYVGLKDLIEGESTYTLPWAMYADDEGNLWLNGNYPLNKEPKGTAKMRVTKRNGGYIVDVSLCKDSRWSRGGGQFVGEFVPLPVHKVVGS